MNFDMPLSRRVNCAGAKSVGITTSVHEKDHFTVVLACLADHFTFVLAYLADGTKLKPIRTERGGGGGGKLCENEKKPPPAGLIFDISELLKLGGVLLCCFEL